MTTSPPPYADVELTATVNTAGGSSDPSTPWSSLVESLTTSGILDHDLRHRPVQTLADLLLGPTPATPTPTNEGREANDDGDGGEQDGGEGASSPPPPPPPPLLLVLVSGSWCAPCRNFTPVLSEMCATPSSSSSGAPSSGVKVLFCSADADAPSFQSYYAKMPSSWDALPYDEDEEDAREDLMEALGALSLPTLLVLDPVGGRLLEANAVHAVQACGTEGADKLLRGWRNKIGSGATEVAKAVKTRTNGGATQDGDNAKDGGDNNEDDEDDEDEALHFHIPSPLTLVCQYFRNRLLSPSLPSTLTTTILRRSVADSDPTAVSLADTLRERLGPGERWLFRTAAPALPGTTYMGGVGERLGLEASAVECWEIYRDGEEKDDNDDNDEEDEDEERPITRAVVNITNETGRSLIVFRERIDMVQKPDGTEVTKTLDLSGVPSVVHGAFRRRWKTESDLIFHALLGTCDAKKKAKNNK